MHKKDSIVTQVYWQPLEKLLNPQRAKSQALPGFDEEFVDIVDYIIRITHRIWERKNIGLCYRYYADICPVFTLGGYSESVESVVQNTLKTIASFPDRSLIGEDVIWRENDDGSYYSSHLITSIMTNTGDSEFGKATNKTGRVTTIADCICSENKIVKEWLVRDNSFLVMQLGIDPIDAAINAAKVPHVSAFLDWQQSEIERISQVKHRDEVLLCREDNWCIESFIHSWAQIIFNQKQFSQLSLFYGLTASQQWPGGRMSTGIAQISGNFIQWLAQCPDAKMTVDHIATVKMEDGSIDVAVRWSLAGHFNPRNPRLKPVAGQQFFVLAASHFYIKNQRIMKEITVFDELALYSNLIRQAQVELELSSAQENNQHA
ncbi:nuclear transport factor 2 family protein [Alteromonadaceae bacterium M269]|nr:nuclear transport factor 2 family protein [Alteromonadaceae bacterium M269]